MRTFFLLLITFCLAACYNKSQPGINNDGINEYTTNFSDTKSEIPYKRWCELCDSMLACGNRLMPNQYSTFLEKGCKLNKEQKIFSTLFSNLASMQSMSPDNYMEVAEGLSDIFGIDKSALARVDFNYLAKAISAMNTNSRSLEENLALLESGQTRTSAEQLKAQEINSVILEEGLAYVIDSEAGRMILSIPNMP